MTMCAIWFIFSCIEAVALGVIIAKYQLEIKQLEKLKDGWKSLAYKAVDLLKKENGE